MFQVIRLDPSVTWSMVRFLVDEDLTNYMEIQNWMRGLGYPQDLSKLHDLQQVPSNRAYEERREWKIYSLMRLLP